MFRILLDMKRKGNSLKEFYKVYKKLYHYLEVRGEVKKFMFLLKEANVGMGTSIIQKSGKKK